MNINTSRKGERRTNRLQLYSRQGARETVADQSHVLYADTLYGHDLSLLLLPLL